MQSGFEGFHGIIPEILVGKALQGYSGLLPNSSNKTKHMLSLITVHESFPSHGSSMI
jgi:hypothetical protein